MLTKKLDEQNRKDLEKEQLRVVEMQLKREKERNIESFVSF